MNLRRAFRSNLQTFVQQQAHSELMHCVSKHNITALPCLSFSYSKVLLTIATVFSSIIMPLLIYLPRPPCSSSLHHFLFLPFPSPFSLSLESKEGPERLLSRKSLPPLFLAGVECSEKDQYTLSSSFESGVSGPAALSPVTAPLPMALRASWYS